MFKEPQDIEIPNNPMYTQDPLNLKSLVANHDQDPREVPLTERNNNYWTCNTNYVDKYNEQKRKYVTHSRTATNISKPLFDRKVMIAALQ